MGRLSPRVASLLDGLGALLRAELGSNLVGLYVYGSLTQQAFDPRRSDVDCVAVVRSRLGLNVASRLRARLGRLGRSYPLARRLQLTILIQRELLQFNGDGWLYQFGRLTRTGSDGNPLIWANILDTGLVIVGPVPHSFVPPITPHALRAALVREVGYLRAELVTNRASHWRNKPAYRRYAVLTLCRILYTLQTGRVVSKQMAADWALRRLPTVHHPTIRPAITQRQRPSPLRLRPLRALLSYVDQRLARRSHPVPPKTRLKRTARVD